MLKWTIPRRTDPAGGHHSSSILTTDATPQKYSTTSRQSFGGQSQRPRPEHRRRSLLTPTCLNKENELTGSQQSLVSIRNPAATSTPFSHTNQNPLRDVRNTTPTSNNNESPRINTSKRKRHSSSAQPRRQQQQQQQPYYASTLPTFGVEYSPMNATRSGPAIALRGITVPDSFFGNARYFPQGELPSKRPKPNRVPLQGLMQQAHIQPQLLNNNEEEDILNMSSKALNDEDLNQLIDDILTSNRKNIPKKNFSPSKKEQQQPLTKNSSSPSDEIAARIKSFKSSHKIPSVLPIDHTKPIDELIEEHPFLRQSIEILASLNTPPKYKDSIDNVDNNHKELRKNTISPKPLSSDLLHHHLGSTTPSNESQNPQHQQQQSIRRCLQFYESPESLDDWMDKRKSVASTISTTSSRYSFRSCGGTSPTGMLDVSLSTKDGRLLVHVIRCKELSRSNGGPVNAYVKLAILPSIIQMPGTTTSSNTSTSYQRTSVRRNSSKPLFDHRFVFEETAYPSTENRRVQLTVWHRDRELKRSEFLGCLSFPIDSILATPTPITGSFRLQPQSSLTNPMPVIPEPHQPIQTPITHQLTEETLRQRNENDLPLYNHAEFMHHGHHSSHHQIDTAKNEVKQSNNGHKISTDVCKTTHVWHTKDPDKIIGGEDEVITSCLDRRKSIRCSTTLDPQYASSLCAH